MADPDREQLHQSRLRARVGLLTAATLAVALAGYFGFRAFAGLDTGSGAGLGLLVVAAATGVAAFFSPCSFPLMLTLLTRQVADQPGRRIPAALRFAIGASLGAVAFVVGFGLLLSMAGSSVASQVTFTSPAGRGLRVAVGLFLILMGLVQLGRIRLPFYRVAALATPFQQRRSPSGNGDGFSHHVLYGFGYLIAGFG